MSKISVVVDSPISSATAIALKKITRISLSDIKRRVGEGSPVEEYMLFLNDHDSVSSALRDIVKLSLREPDRFHFYELERDEFFEVENVPEVHEISAESLVNILDTE